MEFLQVSKNQKKILTPVFRVSFPALFEPTEFQGKKKYSVTMLFDKNADLTEIKAAIGQAIREQWPTKVPPNLRNPLRDGAEKPDLDGYDGCLFIKASSTTRPGVVDQDCKEIIDSAEVYAGCFARATIVPFAYDLKETGARGVSFLLSNVQKVDDGDSFSGRGRASDDFQPIAREESDIFA
jgi:hypothetical protein